MNIKQEIVDAITTIVDSTIKKTCPTITFGLCVGVSNKNKCIVKINNVDYNLSYYGGTSPVTNKKYPVFVPFNNMSMAFILTSGSSGGGEGGAVDDVKINGVSVVSDGIADIPIATKNDVFGLRKTTSNSGITTGSAGQLLISAANQNNIDNRDNSSGTSGRYYNPIVPSNLDMAVKAAMTDRKGESWTETEKAAARERIGVTGTGGDVPTDIILVGETPTENTHLLVNENGTQIELAELSDIPTDSHIREVSETDVIKDLIYELTSIENPVVSAGWALVGNGLCKSTSDSRLVKYSVVAGQTLYLELSADNIYTYQWQKAASVPASGTNANLVGTPVAGTVKGYVTVPDGATYLIVSQFNSNTTNKVAKAEDIKTILETLDANAVKIKGAITATTNLSTLETGMYTIDGITNTSLPISTAFYGSLIQGSGAYKPQLVIGGGTGVSNVYSRRWLTASSSWTSWTSASATDVQINGTSIVKDGVANIPVASGGLGVVWISGGGLRINSSSGWLYINAATQTDLASRSNYYPVVGSNLDVALKLAMTDGVGAAWTEAEQLAAQQRLGIISSEGVGF